MGTDDFWREVAPLGLAVERIERTTESVRVFARSGGDGAACPPCGVVSRMVRYRYGRQLADLPAHGRHVVISVEVRRFTRAKIKVIEKGSFAWPKVQDGVRALTQGGQCAPRGLRRTS